MINENNLKNMRKIKYLVVHCTATPQDTRVKSLIDYWHKVLGWKNNGYHFVIEKNGNTSKITPLDKIANGVQGYNQNSIHLAYIGGIDSKGKAVDTRTIAQKKSLLYYLRDLKRKFPKAEILGHRDFAGVTKECPCFDAKVEYEDIFDIFG